MSRKLLIFQLLLIINVIYFSRLHFSVTGHALRKLNKHICTVLISCCFIQWALYLIFHYYFRIIYMHKSPRRNPLIPKESCSCLSFFRLGNYKIILPKKQNCMQNSMNRRCYFQR